MGWTDLKIYHCRLIWSCILFCLPWCLLLHAYSSCRAFGNEFSLQLQHKATGWVFFCLFGWFSFIFLLLLWEWSRTEQWIFSFLVVTSNYTRSTVCETTPNTGDEHLKPSEMQLLLRRCPVCLYTRCWPGALRPTTPNPSPRGKREFLLHRYAGGISQGYLRKACLCDWVLCQCSLKNVFKLVQWNITLSSYQMRRLSWCCVSARAHLLLDLSLSCTCTNPTWHEASGFWGALGHVKGESLGLCCHFKWALPFLQRERGGLGGLS